MARSSQGSAPWKSRRSARRAALVAYEEPPDKAALRRQATELGAKAKQLSAVERELEKEREAIKAEQDRREADLAEREALVAAQLKDLEDAGK